jgi:hypothetical protein
MAARTSLVCNDANSVREYPCEIAQEGKREW